MKRALGLVTVAASLIAAAPAAASFPGDNGRIAASYFFDDSRPCGDMGHKTCEGDSYDAVRTFWPAGDGVHQLFRCALCGIGNPAWSRSGNRIAWSDGGLRIYVARAFGRGRRIVRGAEGSDPAFSPDGKSLVFISIRGVLTRSPVRGGRARALMPEARLERDSAPTWCGNGRIVFTHGQSQAPHLYSMRPNGRGLKRISDDAMSPADCGANGRVIYSTLRATYLARVDGRGRLKLFNRPLADPVLAPNGRSIAYSDRGHIWTVRMNGRGARRITRGYNGYLTRPLADPPTDEPRPRHYWGQPSWQPLPRR